jgi:hypothetical protein
MVTSLNCALLVDCDVIVLGAFSKVAKKICSRRVQFVPHREYRVLKVERLLSAV